LPYPDYPEKKLPYGKENTEKYRKLKMLNSLECLDYSYTSAYACKIIMHYVPTPERSERRMVSKIYRYVTVIQI
jgi:hypothetical protein